MDRKEIAIYGAGGLGREVAAMLDYAMPGQWHVAGFFDDGLAPGTAVSHWGMVLGGMDTLNAWPGELAVAFAIGSPRALQALTARVTNPCISFPNIVSPNAGFADLSTFAIGRGNIVKDGCWLSTDVTLGDFNILNGDVIVGHDTTLGNCNVIMGGNRISGQVTMGNGCLIGAVSFVLQGLRVADGVTLSPLSALVTKPRPGGLYMGNPARLVKL